ncbi:MAG: tetratricopeptide repeat protein [Bacteroidia bacterium]|nr:tetratricopeptide repeat protein [Bacteroidia bacterium]
MKKGDQSYKTGQYEDAESFYRKSADKESTLKSSYNLGNTTYQLERYEEAIDHYLSATRKTKTSTEESKAFYNLGNAYFKEQNLEEAINAYKQAIRIDPTNDKARYNLAVLKELMKRMQKEEQQKQNQEQEENKDQQDSQNQEESQEGENQQEQEQEQSESQQDSTQQIESSFDSSRLEKQNLDSLDAAKLLQIIQNEEQKVQEKLRKFNSNRKKPDKDW